MIQPKCSIAKLVQACLLAIASYATSTSAVAQQLPIQAPLHRSTPLRFAPIAQASPSTPRPAPASPVVANPTLHAQAAQVLWARMIQEGREAFEVNCTDCHEAEQALDESKTFDAWMKTIQEMSEKEDADIPKSAFVPIATFLATNRPVATTDTVPKKQDVPQRALSAIERKGRDAFNDSCTTCHEGERSLKVKKSYRAWMQTIERMAKKEDADLNQSTFHPIAAYLASRTDAEVEAVASAAKQEERTSDSDKSDKRSVEDDRSQASDAQVQAGKTAFYQSCVDCHDAERSLSAEKSFNEWMATIRRMAAKEDADIDSADFRPIASFLSARSTAEINEAKEKANEEDEDEKEGDAKKFDPALVSAGQAAFNRGCLQCHDAERSLSKKKSLAAWRATVKRMAAKDGANVPASDVEAIATYLAAESAGGDGEIADGGGEVGPWAFSTTLSTQHRAASDPIENSGFFVDAWMGADWQSDGPLRATVMVCTSCHSDRNTSKGFTFELVEASATVDLKMILTDHFSERHASPAHGNPHGNPHGMMNGGSTAANPTASSASPISTAADMKMGRFVVPFGSFSSISHPGSYRTVSNPLMYNMGRRINTGGPYQPVLPAPYSDEGVNFHFGLREYCDRSYTLDLYAVNGLQGNASGANFNLSRAYTDNNRVPAVGGRFTLGNQRFRLGTSGMTGRMQADGSSPLHYHFVGADASYNGDRLRAYFEYAIRVDDLGFPARNETDGYVVELEYKLRDRLGLLARYDTLDHRLATAGDLHTERFTWGLNLTLPRAGLLLLNHEHWMQDDRTDVDVVGLRWVTAF